MHRTIRLCNTLVDIVVLVLLFLVLLFAGYSLWDGYTIYQSADSQQFATYQPAAYDPEASKPTNQRFAELQAQNPDVFGWIHLFGTPINYPLVQGEDNNEYLNHDPHKNFSISGSLFLDSLAAKDFSQFSSVIYGHHMEKDKMFGPLDHYLSVDYAQKHPRGNLYYDGAYHGFDVVTFLDTNAYDPYIYLPSDSPDRQASLLHYLKEKGSYQLAEASLSDHLVMLSTCADGTDQRYVLVVKLKDQAYREPKRKVYQENTLEKVVHHYWWLWLSLLALLVLILYLLYRYYKNKKIQKEKPYEEL